MRPHCCVAPNLITGSLYTAECTISTHNHSLSRVHCLAPVLCDKREGPHSGDTTQYTVHVSPSCACTCLRMSLYCIASEEDTKTESAASNQEDEADCGINPHNVISSRYASTEAQLYMRI